MNLERSTATKDKLWTWVAQLVAVLTPLLVTLERFRRPFGEKYMFSHFGGSADLWVIYNGAAAIARHLDPYGPLPPDLQDPTGWPASYPPQTLGMFVPLVWATKGNIEAATQFLFWLNMVALAVYSVATWRLMLKLSGGRFQIQSALLTAVMALTLNPMTMFAVDRGQSEIISAAVAWTAILTFCKRRYALAIALATFAAAIKGFAVPLAFGLLFAIPNRKDFIRGLGAALGVSVILTIPVLPFLVHGVQALLDRLQYFFVVDPINVSFKAVFHHISADHSDVGRKAMCALTSGFTVFAWWRLSRTTRQTDDHGLALRTVIFGGLSLALMVGLPVFTGPYTYLLALPAVFLSAVCLPSFLNMTKLRGWPTLAIGSVAILSLWGAMKYRFLDCSLSLAGSGLVGYVLVAGCLTTCSVFWPAQTTAAEQT